MAVTTGPGMAGNDGGVQMISLGRRRARKWTALLLRCAEKSMNNQEGARDQDESKGGALGPWNPLTMPESTRTAGGNGDLRRAIPRQPDGIEMGFLGQKKEEGEAYL